MEERLPMIIFGKWSMKGFKEPNNCFNLTNTSYLQVKQMLEGPSGLEKEVIMIIEKKNKEGLTIWKVDKTTKYYEYCFKPDCPQSKIIKKLYFSGFSKQPTCLNGNGYGYSKVLKLLPYFIRDTFGSVDELHISDSVDSKITKPRGKVSVTINKEEYDDLVQACIETYRENSKNLRDVNAYHLNKIFPEYFEQNSEIKYKKNTIRDLLNDDSIIDQLSAGDIENIAKIIPNLIDKSVQMKKSILEKILFIDLEKKVNGIKLSKIVNEYETILKKSHQSESDWQSFLKKNILFFNSSYLNVIEKTNISLRISIPDFLLVDQFQSIDIFEIKRPDFTCLKYDKSHDNYYWSENMTKAISQVENYIYEIENNANGLIVELQNIGYSLKIIRPKGFILFGKRTELDSAKKINSFKILANSLKNIQIIFYDDFLDAIKYKYALIK